MTFTKKQLEAIKDYAKNPTGCSEHAHCGDGCSLHTSNSKDGFTCLFQHKFADSVGDNDRIHSIVHSLCRQEIVKMKLKALKEIMK